MAGAVHVAIYLSLSTVCGLSVNHWAVLMGIYLTLSHLICTVNEQWIDFTTTHAFTEAVTEELLQQRSEFLCNHKFPWF
jgi:putative flippase GtrA